jgi:hypothetical protein
LFFGVSTLNWMQLEVVRIMAYVVGQKEKWVIESGWEGEEGRSRLGW